MEATATENTDETTAVKSRVTRLPRQGNVHATIFENQGANGTFHTVSFQRGYMKDDKLNFTDSFKATDMPDLAKQAEAVQKKVA